MLDKTASEALIKQIKLCFEEAQYISNKSKEFRQESEQINSHQDLQKRRDSLTYGHLSTLYKTQGAALSLIYTILEKIYSLPNKEEIEIIKKELAKKVEETLTPISEAFKEQKERENNIGDIYQ